jgi:hypothetical protein
MTTDRTATVVVPIPSRESVDAKARRYLLEARLNVLMVKDHPYLRRVPRRRRYLASLLHRRQMAMRLPSRTRTLRPPRRTATRLHRTEAPMTTYRHWLTRLRAWVVRAHAHLHAEGER